MSRSPLLSPAVTLGLVPGGSALLVGVVVSKAGRWTPLATVFALMGATVAVLGLLVLAADRPPARPRAGRGGRGRLGGGPTAGVVRDRAAALHAEHPDDTPAELAARVREWYGGGRVNRFAGAGPDGCVMGLLLLPVWLIRDALVAPTQEEFDQSVSDAVTEATGQFPPPGGGW